MERKRERDKANKERNETITSSSNLRLNRKQHCTWNATA